MHIQALQPPMPWLDNVPPTAPSELKDYGYQQWIYGIEMAGRYRQ